MKTVAVFSEATLPGRFAADLEALLFNLIRVEIAPVDLTEAKALAYDARRGQIDAEALLDILKGASGFDKTAYIIEGDAYVRGLNFVFGAAYGDKALVFTARLRAEDEGLYRTRILKELAHELGHSFGLGHCPDRRCVMRFSNTLSDTDAKGPGFCGDCAAKLRRALRK